MTRHQQLLQHVAAHLSTVHLVIVAQRSPHLFPFRAQVALFRGFHVDRSEPVQR